MSETPLRDPACETALRFLDSYIPTESPGESDRQMLKHLEECPSCAIELDRRKRLAGRLRQAVHGEAVDPALAATVRRRIEEYEHRRRAPWYRSRQLLVFASLMALCAGTWQLYRHGHLRFTRGAQDAYISSISSHIARTLRVGLGDHVHCTVFRKFPKNPEPAAKMVTDLGPEYAGLLPLLSAQAGNEYRVMMAHRCSYRGRKFVHFTLKHGSALVSLVIARKALGESFRRDNLLPVLGKTDIPIYQGGVQRFAVAGFETRDHLVYLVSDLDGPRNLALLAALSEPVGTYLARMEA